MLLDVMIPGEDGFVICEKMRKQVDVPIIFLSCLTETDDCGSKGGAPMRQHKVWWQPA